jgi:hypothetical protein
LEKVNALLAQTDSAQLADAQRTLMLLNDELSKVDAGSARFVQLQEAILGVQDRLTELAGTFPELQFQSTRARLRARDTARASACRDTRF